MGPSESAELPILGRQQMLEYPEYCIPLRQYGRIEAVAYELALQQEQSAHPSIGPLEFVPRASFGQDLWASPQVRPVRDFHAIS